MKSAIALNLARAPRLYPSLLNQMDLSVGHVHSPLPFPCKGMLGT